MKPTLTPSLRDLPDAVRSNPRLAIIGAGTKARSLDHGDHVVLSTRQLRGIVEYEPEEFVITALAGTPVRDVVSELASHGQHLPFDPLLVATGATVGGVVATATNGPGRFRFGGVRDFILGVRFVDGAGDLLRAGSKVVKNAAGFDLPKFFTGSRGGFGLLVEITLKVFPRPQSELTLRLPVATHEEAAALMAAAARSRWQPHALDFPPGGDAVLVRLAGPTAALEPMGREILVRRPGTMLDPDQAADCWTELIELRWAYPEGPWFKLALPSAHWPEVLARIETSSTRGRIHVTSGGDTAYASWPAGTDETIILAALAVPGVSVVRLDRIAPSTPNGASRPAIYDAVKAALDPGDRFLLPIEP